MIMEWMDRWLDLGMNWMSLVLLAAWRTLPLFAIASVVTLFLRRSISPAIQALVWVLVIARLLLPVSVASPMSIHAWIDSMTTMNEEPQILQYKTSTVDQFLGTVDQFQDIWLPQPKPKAEINADLDLGSVLVWAVIMITIAILLRGCIAYGRFARLLRKSCEITDQTFIDSVLRECDDLAIGRRPRVYEVESLSTPAVFGLVRPAICLPSGLREQLSNDELRWVLRHELAHIKRRDIWTVTIATIARSLHWINPFAWFSVRKLKEAIEAAADRMATRGLSQNEVVAYGELLLRLATKGGSSPTKSAALGLLPFVSGKHLKRRIQSLSISNPHRGFIAKACGLAFVFAIAMVGLTDASNYVDVPEPRILIPHTIMNASKAPLVQFAEADDFGVREDRIYDVTTLRESIPDSLHIEEPFEQLLTWIPFLRSYRERLRLDGNMLHASLTTNQHVRISQLLEAWKNGEPQQITFEVRFVQTTIDTASVLPWIENKIDSLQVDGKGPAMAATISEEQLASFIQSVQSDRAGNIMFAPKVTLFNGQTGLIVDEVQRPFVTQVRTLPTGTAIEPIISTIDEGLRVSLSPMLKDENSLELEFSVRASKIDQISLANLPIRQALQSEVGVTVEVPQTSVKEVRSTISMQPTQSIAVAIPQHFTREKGWNSQRISVVTLTPRVLSEH